MVTLPPLHYQDIKDLPYILQEYLRILRQIVMNGLLNHNDLQNIQGGSATERYHLSASQAAILNNTTSGKYTPTLTNVTNLDASTAYECQYIRVGNNVTVAGKVDIDPTAAAAIELGISLPVASNFGAQEDCGGTAASPTNASAQAIRADSANDRAALVGIASHTNNQSYFFTFTYEII